MVAGDGVVIVHNIYALLPMGYGNAPKGASVFFLSLFFWSWVVGIFTSRFDLNLYKNKIGINQN